MQSLTELNSHSRFIYEGQDQRNSQVIFDRLLSIVRDKAITAATAVTVSEAVNIVEIVNYSTANVRFRVTLNTPSGFVSSVSWASIPAGLTLTQVGKVYTISGIKTPAEWNIIKSFTWNIPANFNSYPNWSLACEIIYFDDDLNQDVTVAYDVYDPNYFTLAELTTASTLSCNARKNSVVLSQMTNAVRLTCDVGDTLSVETNIVANFRRVRFAQSTMPSVTSAVVASIDNFMTLSYTLTTITQKVKFDLVGVSNARVYWGDGTFTDVTSNGRVEKSYASIGTKRVNIVGSYTGFHNRSKTLRRVISFPNSGLTYLSGLGTDLLEIPSQLPASVRDLSGCFSRTAFQSGISDDVVSATDPHFNLTTIVNWDISNITSISVIFADNKLFNTSLNNWNTANVTNMSGAFSSSIYNQPLNNWNTQNVTDMSFMFSGSGTTPNPFNQNISNWNTSNVTNMNSMFKNSAFNQPIGNWNVSKVTNMSWMFEFNRQFNQPLNNWNTISVTSMQRMFAGSVFNQPIGNWNVSNVRSMSFMFQGYTTTNGLPKHPFNQPIGSWNTANVRSVRFMFQDSVFNQPIGLWNTGNFGNPNGNIDGTFDSLMRGMFQNNTAFDQNISGWCMTYIPSKPQDFDTGTSTSWTTAEKPQWGLCP